MRVVYLLPDANIVAMNRIPKIKQTVFMLLAMLFLEE